MRWYAEAPVADAHADSLLWNRDLNVASTEGHADFPRLHEGGIRVQAFTIPTWGLPVVNGMGLFAWWRRWPRSARRSPLARALWQAERLADHVSRSGGRVALVRTCADLDRCLASGTLAALLGIEGAQALEGDPKNLRRFFDLGVRFLGPSHLIPNEFASCSYWAYRDRGLSGLGRELLAEMARLGMGLDLAHASPRAFDEMLVVAEASGGRLAAFDSHTGVRGARPSWRHLSDGQLRALARAGGVVAMILAREYLGGRELRHFVAHVRHAASVIGAEHIALGSDFDGFVRLPVEMRDARDFPLIAPTLRAAGFGREESTGILGANLVRWFRSMLPA